ncbi:hypothetical protein A2U01_0081174, partial [Trifolium medium]|nr:hypothetical protein [Trifolium medium]
KVLGENDGIVLPGQLSSTSCCSGTLGPRGEERYDLFFCLVAQSSRARVIVV